MDGGRAAEQGDPPRDGPPTGGDDGGGGGGPGDGCVATGGPVATKKEASSSGGGGGDGAAATAVVVAAANNAPEASGRPVKRQKAHHPPAETPPPNGAAGEGNAPAASPAGTTGATTPPAGATSDAGGEPTAGAEAPTETDSPVAALGDCPAGDAVWASLLSSNATFAAEGNRPPVEGVSVAHREALAAGQSPTAVVVTCSDSRVSPELLFSRGLGELFVIRTAGNTAAYDSTVASVEYAVHNLGSPLVVVLGHTKCGAVAAAVATAADGNAMVGQPPTLAAFVKAALVAPVHAVKEREGVTEAEFVSACEVENVAAAVRSLVTTSAWMGEARAGGKVKVVGALYDVAAGTVTEV